MSEQSQTGADAIEIRIESIAQLFHSLDPSPFHEKDLDKDAEEFIVSWARELPSDIPLKIVVHLPGKQLALPEAKNIGPAITRFFSYRAQMIGLELKETLSHRPPLACHRCRGSRHFNFCQSIRRR
jgi:hypothetical protein